MEITSIAPQEPTFEDYFGTPCDPGCSYPSQVKPFDGSDHGTWTLPKAYVGQSRSMSRFISNYIDANDSFWTRDLLPVQRTNDITVQWDETTYAAQQVGEVPELGVSRLLEADTESGSENLVRRGLGIMMEKGPMETQRGYLDYTEKLLALQTSVALTNDLDALRAIVVAGYKNELRRRDKVTNDLTGHLQCKATMFDALKKSVNGFEMLTSMMEERARENGESFNRVVMPAAAGIYLTQADPDRTDYGNVVSSV